MDDDANTPTSNTNNTENCDGTSSLLNSSSSSSVDVNKRQKSEEKPSPNGDEPSSSVTDELVNCCSQSPLKSLPFGVAASPPRFVAMEEVMKAANGVSNMYLAHEIAVDQDFRLEKVQPQSDGLKSQVEDVMKKAFWDILQSQLNESPAKFKQALCLLLEMKEDLLSLLLPQHTKLKQEIEEILDLDLIKQQAENGALDFPRYAQYVLSVMARLCAPIRDDRIRELTQTNDVVSLFRGLMELLELMKLDMANFTIQQMRPAIQQQSVDYERKKFDEFLASQAKISNGLDGLEFTKKWLKRNYLSIDVSNEASHQQVTNKVLGAAFIELLIWDDSKQDMYPETLLMDESRFTSLKENVSLYTLLGSTILVTFATVGPTLQQLAEFKETLKKHLLLLLNEKEVEESVRLESAAIQVIDDVKHCLKEHDFLPLDEAKEMSLKTQITDLSKPDNRVRQIIQRRILEFVEGIAASNTASPVQIPSGLSVLQDELSSLTGSFMRIVSHNRAVFGEHYVDIISNLTPQSM